MNKAEFIEKLSQDNLRTGEKLKELHQIVWESAQTYANQSSKDAKIREAGRLFDEIIEERVQRIIQKILKDTQ